MSTLLNITAFLALISAMNFAIAESVDLEKAALRFATAYSENFFKGKTSWLEDAMNPKFARKMSDSGVSMKDYVELRHSVYFSEPIMTVTEELGQPHIIKAGSEIAAFVPWRKERDYGIYLAKSVGLYMLFTADGGKTWSIYDNDCSHRKFLKQSYPEIYAQVDLEKVAQFHSAAAIIDSSKVEIVKQ